MTHIISLSLLLLLSFVTKAQTPKQLYENGRKAFTERQYEQAAALFIKGWNQTSNAQFASWLAFSYHRMNKDDDAKKWAKKALDTPPELAEMYQRQLNNIITEGYATTEKYDGWDISLSNKEEKRPKTLSEAQRNLRAHTADARPTEEQMKEILDELYKPTHHIITVDTNVINSIDDTLIEN